MKNRHYYRRWGYYVILYESEHLVIKMLYIRHGCSTHLQTHEYKNERWDVLRGIADARILGMDCRLTNSTGGFTIHKEMLHKITGFTNCVVLEHQYGSKVLEEDIIHYE